MANRKRVTWGRVEEICKAKGIAIQYGKGSERKLKGPSPDGMVRVQTIGHEWCKSAKTIVPHAVLAAFMRNFGIKNEDF